MNDHNAPLIKQLLSMGELRPMVETALKLQKANEALQSLLQEPFKNQVTVGQLQQGCMTLDVPNASMLTILRYQSSDILRQIRQVQGLAGIASIKCRIKIPDVPVPLAPAPIQPAPPQPLSAEAKRVLKSTAERIDDPALQAILLKLSER